MDLSTAAILETSRGCGFLLEKKQSEVCKELNLSKSSVSKKVQKITKLLKDRNDYKRSRRKAKSVKRAVQRKEARKSPKKENE